jgi:hypothetical protein
LSIWVRLSAVAIVLFAGYYLYRELTRTRVLLAGDSLMALAGPPAKSKLGSHGFAVQVKAAPGTGLLDTGFDWLHFLHGEGSGKATVVLEFVGNYLPPRSPAVPPDSLLFFAAWAARDRELIAEMNTEGADVYLVLVPPMRDPQLDKVGQALNQLSLTIARSEPGHVGCIDGKTPLSGPGGTYADSLPGPGGKSQRVRTADGVHLTPAGSKRLADAIAGQLIRAKGHPPPPCAITA